MRKTAAGRRLKPAKIDRLVQSLTVLNVDVSKVEARLARGRVLSGPNISGLCIIDITCCIIDCSKCKPQDVNIYVNPANVLEGFLFKLPEQAKNPDAPLYYVPKMNVRTAFRLGHRALKAPSKMVEAKVVGIAGEILNTRTLSSQKISPTASVIALTPTKLAKTAKTAVVGKTLRNV